MVGFVLLAAATLKTLYPPPSLPLRSPWFPIGLAEIELSVGVWLWIGVWPAGSRLISLTLFWGFAVFNWAEGAKGAVSCACFGPINLTPYLAALLDILMIVVLSIWRPEPVPKSLGRVRSQGAILILWLLLQLLIGVAAGKKSFREGPGLVASPTDVDLGTVSKGQEAEARFVLRNEGHHPAILADVETSCPCLRALLSEVVVPPGKEITGEILLDLRREPHFSGKLAMEVKAYLASGEPAFFLGIRAEVR